MTDPRALWGHLYDRYHPATPRQRRILACDGGGIRGIITVEVLRVLERKLAAATGAGDGFRLCQWFDFIGGTSTGAIIAAALARGRSVAEVADFYRGFGTTAFTKRQWYERWRSLYGDGPLKQKLQEVYGANATLEPQHLETLLLVVTHNATTDSAWPISSNPDAKYNDPTRPDCNLRIPLWQLVRASTAAPVYFPPEVIRWDPTNPEKTFTFRDGGLDYNSPAFLMARMATDPAYRLNWPKGEGNLLVVSVGTGSAPALGATPDDPETNLISEAKHSLMVVMNQAQLDQDINCRTVGRCSFGPFLDREVDDLVPRAGSLPVPLSQDLGRAFLYARYDNELTRAGLDRLGLKNIDPARISKMDSTAAIDELTAIGQALARQVDLAHFGSFVQHPGIPTP